MQYCTSITPGRKGEETSSTGVRWDRCWGSDSASDSENFTSQLRTPVTTCNCTQKVLFLGTKDGPTRDTSGPRSLLYTGQLEDPVPHGPEYAE